MFAAKAQAHNSPETVPPAALDPAFKASADAMFGDGNNPLDVNLTADLASLDGLTRGEKPAAETPTPAGGVVASEPSSEIPPATPDVTETPATPETPAAETPAVETPETPAVETPETPEVETPAVETPETPATPEVPAKPEDEEADKVRRRLNRANFKSDEDFNLAVKSTALMNEFGLTPSAAETQARSLLGLPAAGAAPATPATPDAGPENDADLTQAEATFKAARQAFVKATVSYAGEEAVTAAEEAVETAREARDTARRVVESRKAASIAFTQNAQAAMTEFPTAKVEGSPLYNAVYVRFATMKADDPLRSNPERAMLITRQEAAKLSIKGISEKTTTATTPPAKPVPAAKPTKIGVASGAARTTTPATPSKDGLQRDLANLLGPKNAHMVGPV
jgi:hypothetical protein